MKITVKNSNEVLECIEEAEILIKRLKDLMWSLKEFEVEIAEQSEESSAKES